MLRRRPDDTWELRFVEEVLLSVRPAPISLERRQALWARIHAALGKQEGRRHLALVAPERWVAVPAGLGLVAAAIAAARVASESDSREARDPVRALAPSGAGSAEPGQFIRADSDSWISLASDVAVGLEATGEFRYERIEDHLSLFVAHGNMTVATGTTLVAVHGQGWTALLHPGALARFEVGEQSSVVTAFQGSVQLLVDGQPPVTLAPETRTSVFAPGSPPATTGDALPAPAAADAPAPAPATSARPGSEARGDSNVVVFAPRESEPVEQPPAQQRPAPVAQPHSEEAPAAVQLVSPPESGPSSDVEVSVQPPAGPLPPRAEAGAATAPDTAPPAQAQEARAEERAEEKAAQAAEKDASQEARQAERDARAEERLAEKEAKAEAKAQATAETGASAPPGEPGGGKPADTPGKGPRK